MLVWSFRYLKFLNKHADLAPLGGLPEVPRDVEESGLEEEHEANPLVVLVVLNFSSISKVRIRTETDIYQAKTYKHKKCYTCSYSKKCDWIFSWLRRLPATVPSTLLRRIDWHFKFCLIYFAVRGWKIFEARHWRMRKWVVTAYDFII